MNNTTEHLITRYKNFLFRIHGRPIKGILSKGVPCNMEDPTPDKTHGDVVHPCVRYIPEGFEGHQWWMVYTPYYGKTDGMENPRLCYADAKEGEVPTTWKFYCIIKDKPEKGYNSDPTLIFHCNKLYVFWRENETDHAKNLGYSRATFGCCVQQNEVTYLESPTLVEKTIQTDHEICPTIMETAGKLYAYSIHIRFNPKWVFYFPQSLMRQLYRFRIIEFAYLLVGSNRMKTHGAALWEGEAIEKPFQYVKTIPFKGVSRLYRPWHMDLFEAENEEGKTSLFAVVQTDEKFADICLAQLKDNHFQFYPQPLVTNKSIGMIGIYKPCAVMLNDTFYLYYTARDDSDASLNRLFVTSMPWKKVLKRQNMRKI